MEVTVLIKDKAQAKETLNCGKIMRTAQEMDFYRDSVRVLLM
jgi:hypothetical protein